MARSSSGRSVARAAATGGGTTYRGQMPVNWYAALVIIVVVGVASIALAKYNYNRVPTVVEPTVGTSWHAGLSFDICGTVEPALAASPSSATTGLTTTGSGVLVVAPKTSSEAGDERDPREVRRRVYRIDVDQHEIDVPVDQGHDVHQRGEVRRRHARCRQGRRGAGALVGDLDHDLQEQRGERGRGRHDAAARRPQVRQSPTDHGRIRAGGHRPAQTARLDHPRSGAGVDGEPGAGGHDDHHRRRGRHGHDGAPATSTTIGHDDHDGAVATTTTTAPLATTTTKPSSTTTTK